MSSLTSSERWPSTTAAMELLNFLHYASPIVILFFFILAFAARSIASSRSSAKANSARSAQFGPGGKPLPVRSHSFKTILPQTFSRSRKTVFEWLAVGVLLTFVANATVVIVHALVKRQEHWWCGQALTVSSSATSSTIQTPANHQSNSRFTLSAPSSRIPCS